MPVSTIRNSSKTRLLKLLILFHYHQTRLSPSTSLSTNPRRHRLARRSCPDCSHAGCGRRVRAFRQMLFVSSLIFVCFDSPTHRSRSSRVARSRLAFQLPARSADYGDDTRSTDVEEASEQRRRARAGRHLNEACEGRGRWCEGACERLGVTAERGRDRQSTAQKLVVDDAVLW